MKPNSENKDPEIQIRTQNAKKVLIKDQVRKIRTLLETVPNYLSPPVSLQDPVVHPGGLLLSGRRTREKPDNSKYLE